MTLNPFSIISITSYSPAKWCSVAIMLALPLTGCDTTPATRVTPLRSVSVVRISPQGMASQRLLTGEIAPHEETVLGFRTDGRIIKRMTDVGQPVSAGTVLAELDDTDLRNQYRRAQAAVREAQASARLAEMNQRRMASLAPLGAIARVQLDEARTNRDTAAAQLTSAEADLSNARERLGYTTLLSPVTGVVTSVSGSAGQVVSAGQEVLRVAEDARRDAVFSAPASLLEILKKQQRLTLRLADSKSVTVEATLRDISPLADAQTRTWRVRYTLDTPPAAMAMGATVTGMLPLAESAVFSVPASALTRRAEQPAVFVIDPETKTLHVKPVEIASYSTATVNIKTGLQSGDHVVIAGVSQLRDGEKIAAEIYE